MRAPLGGGGFCTGGGASRRPLYKEKRKGFSRLEKCNAKTLLIVDEAHHVGAGNTLEDVEELMLEKKDLTQGARRGLSDKYDFRLALSATIVRYFDDEGTDYLRNYFSGTKTGDDGKPLSTVINFDLKRAIDECSNCKESKKN